MYIWGGGMYIHLSGKAWSKQPRVEKVGLRIGEQRWMHVLYNNSRWEAGQFEKKKERTCQPKKV